MVNIGALMLLLFAIILKICTTAGQLIEGKAEPTQYISFPPSTYDEGSYTVTHTIGNCISSRGRVDGNDEDVVICPNGELLLDGITETNLEDDVVDSDIRTFYTWEERSIPGNEAFITLHFPNSAITPTRVAVYCLELRDPLRIREPRQITLYSSTTDSIFPNTEIQDVDDNNFVVTSSGRTSANDDYEYRRYDLIIPENRQVSLNYLRMSLDFERGSWVFISEVEVYHMFEQLPTTTSSIMLSSSVTSSSIQIIPSSSTATRTSVTMLSSSTSNIIQTSTIAPFSTPVFVFPNTNPLVLNLNRLPLDVTINCTVIWDGDLSQLTTVWSYNGTMISDSQKYFITAEDHLVIRQFTAQDVGTYECIVKHPSGWNGSRQYFISTSQGGNIIQQPRGDESSKDSSLPVIIGAVIGSIGLLMCLAIVICLVLCYKKKKRGRSEKRNSAYSVTEKSASFLHPYEYADNGISPEERKRSIDNVYEHMTTSTSQSKAPTLPRRLPKAIGQPKIPELPAPKLPKLKYDSAFLGDYIHMDVSSELLSYDEHRETFFDIYDDTIISTISTSIPPRSPQDVYIEAFDYNSTGEKVYDVDSDAFNMCGPIYDDPNPLAKTEGPKYVEWSNVKVVAKIGEGQFGDVYLAEISGIDTDELAQSKTLAAIKTLKGNYSPSLKQEFEKEIKFMSQLNNENVVRMLGICNKKTPFIMMEYMSNGDLHMFLMKHYLPEVGQDTTGALIPADSLILQYIALQIANGMRYLASFGFIHRDLAARNCLVGEDYIVKIADFGMTQNLYNQAYFRMRGNAFLPIRWMAPESFFGRFSTKTDVWSYGVTLWEIFTLCRTQPYDEMTDEEFITDAQKGFKKSMLKRPPSIPDEVYNVMTVCWNYSPIHRPDFESVYNQLFDYYMQHSQ